MMINRLLCAIAVILLAMPIAFATTYTNNAFNDSTTAKNLTSTGNENQTVYINIPINANVTSAYLKLTGHSIVTGVNDSDTGIGGSYTGWTISNDTWGSQGFKVSTIYDTMELEYINLLLERDYSLCSLGNVTVSIREANGTFSPIGSDLVNITFPISDLLAGGNHYWVNPIYMNLTMDSTLNYSVILRHEGDLSAGCFLRWRAKDVGDTTYYSKNLGSTWVSQGWTTVDTVVYVNTSTMNAYIEMGTLDGNYEWNYTTKFNITSTADLNISAIQSYLDSCSPDSNGNCSVPLLLHSDTAGKIELSSLTVNYTDVFVWANTTPTSRNVYMPVSQSDSFTVAITNKGYFPKSFLVSCEGSSFCSNITITTTLSGNTTSSLDYLESHEFTITATPTETAKAGVTYYGNITINGSGTINRIPLTYVLSAAPSGGGGGGGGGVREIIPECPDGYEAVRNPATRQYECIASPVPLLEAENFLLNYPVVLGLSLWTIILTLIAGYMLITYNRTRQLTYLLGLAAIIFLAVLTVPLPLFTNADNILNSIANQTAQVIP